MVWAFAVVVAGCMVVMGAYVVRLCHKMDDAIRNLENCAAEVENQVKHMDFAFSRIDIVRRKTEDVADRIEREADELVGERERTEKAQTAFEEGYSNIMNFSPDAALNAVKDGGR